MDIEGIEDASLLPDFASWNPFPCEVDMEISSVARPAICVSFSAAKRLHPSRVVIILNDGSQWIVKGGDNKEGDAIFNTIVNQWQVGDDIRVEEAEESSEFVLKNVREGRAFLTRLSQTCADVANAFFIEKVDPSGYLIQTTGGKLWSVGYFGAFTTQDWENGQRVIINKSTHSKRYEDYEMINPNNGSSAWVTQVFVDRPLDRLG